MLSRRSLLTGAACLPAIASVRPRSAHARTVLFAQPTITDGIAPHFSTNGQFPQFQPFGEFFMKANQVNPYAKPGLPTLYSPVLWDAGMRTGLSITDNRSFWQRGIWDTTANTGRQHTTAQMWGEAVGAYLFSPDLFLGSPENRMMIAPQYKFPIPVATFPRAASSLAVSLDLQVPTASDLGLNGVSNTYVKIDLQFQCLGTQARLSFSASLFLNNGYPKNETAGFDDLSRTAIIFAHAEPWSQRLTLASGSSVVQSQPWVGWKPFGFTVSSAQFASGLRAAQPVARSFGYTLSLDPTRWVLIATHLNAELHGTPSTPAALGWSMRRLIVGNDGTG